MYRCSARSGNGSAALLAIIFVATFTTLAAGLYGMVNTSIRIADNERRAAQAQAAAEGGLEYIKFALSSTQISPSAKSREEIYVAVAVTLKQQYDTTICAAFGGIGVEETLLRIPASGQIPLTPSSASASAAQAGSFSATLQPHPASTDSIPLIEAAVTGSSGGVSRCLRAVFRMNSIPNPSPYNFGIAAAGDIIAKNNVNVQEAGISSSTRLMLSAKPSGLAIDIKNVDNRDLRGDVAIMPAASASLDQSISVLRLEEPPAWPTFHMADYKKSCAVYPTWSAYLANPPAPGARIYIESGDVNLGSCTIDGALLCGPGVTTITMDSVDVKGAPGFPYAILAPRAAVLYNGNTHLSTQGYVVVSSFKPNSNQNNSSTISMTSGGLITLNPASGSLDLGQSDFSFSLPSAGENPLLTIAYRNFLLLQASYREHVQL